jgi:arsenate reductase
MIDRIYQVLFLCTGNSARSILAEALLNHRGRGRFVAHSAGSDPAGRVNPYALVALEEMRVPAHHPRSKSWHEFAVSDGQCGDMDFIVTVCDNAAGEVCPVWPGHPVTAHWGMADPAAVQGNEAQKRQAFREAFETLQTRIQGLIELPIDELNPAALKQRLNELGRLPDHAARFR